ncbi:MAG: dTDP-4-dehydrorhamnose 3,5-epimerase [Sulfolobales archaeon]
MPFKFKTLEIPDIVVIEYISFPDHRGFFAEIYKRSDFLSNGIPYDYIQANMSFSRRSVIRGLHYQLKPAEQGKLVYVIQGRIYDVAVDIRKGSPYYGKHVAEEIYPGKAIWIPPGFAHGFQAIEDSIVVYMVTKEYSPSHERCIYYRDEDLAIKWPLQEAIVSEKDSKCPKFRYAETNFGYPI